MFKGVMKLAVCAMMLFAFTATSAFAAATIATPANGSKLGAMPEFTWVKDPGQTSCWLDFGSSVGAYNYKSVPVDNDTSAVISDLPGDNATIYLRLWTLKTGVWSSNDYTYIGRTGSATDAAVISSPANGSAIGGNTTFTWTGGTGASFHLLAGTSVGGANLCYTITSSNSAVVYIPSSLLNTPVYVRLYTSSGRSWSYRDYSYNTPAAVITFPAANGAQLGFPATFAWTNDGADYYWLDIGSTGVGSYNLSSKCNYQNLTATVPGLTNDNATTINVRLWSLHGTRWVFNDYNFKASAGAVNSDRAVISSPANDNDTILSDNQTFVWGAKANANNYQMLLGTTQGASNLGYYNCASNTSQKVRFLAGKVYVRLITSYGLYNAYKDSYYQVR